MKVFSFLIKTVIGLIVLLIILGGFTLYFFDPNDYKEQMSAQVEKATGRALVIKGDIGWTLYPWLGIEARDINLGNAKGFMAHDFLSADRLVLQVGLMPFVSGDIEVDNLELSGASIHLRRDEKGQDNWSDMVQSVSSNQNQSGEDPTFNLTLNRVTLRNVNLAYTDKKEGSNYSLNIKESEAHKIDFKNPFPLSIEASVKGDNLSTITFTLSSQIRADIETTNFEFHNLELALDTNKANLRLDTDMALRIPEEMITFRNMKLSSDKGQLTGDITTRGFSGFPSINGKLGFNDFSIAKALAFVGHSEALPDGAFESINGKLDISSDGKKLEAVLNNITVDNSHINGWLKATSLTPFKGRFDLKLDKLDLNKYQSLGSKSSSSASSPTKAPNIELTGGLVIGNLNVSGQEVKNIKTTLALTGDKAKLKDFSLQVIGVPVSGTLKVANITKELAYSGHIKTGQFNLRQFLNNFRVKVQTTDKNVLGSTRVSSSISGNANSINISGLKMTMDQSHLSGSLKVLSFKNPSYKFNLNIDKINIDRYLPPPGQSSGNKEMDLTALKTLNLKKSKATIKKLRIFGINMQNMQVNAKAGGGKIRLHPISSRLYKGSYLGNISLDVRKKALAWRANEKFKNIDSESLLKDLLGKSHIKGRMTLTGKVSGQGTNMDAIFANVNGDIRFNFANGAVKGFNLAHTLREVKAKLGQTPKNVAGEKKTDFTELSGTAKLAKGVLKNSDLKAKSPYLRIGGKGKMNLVAGSLNYRVNAKVVDTSKGQGGKEFKELEGIEIPIRIKGPLGDLKIYPDIEAVLKSKAKLELEKQKEQLKQKLEKEKTDIKAKLKKEEKKVKEKLKDKLKEELLKGLKF